MLFAQGALKHSPKALQTTFVSLFDVGKVISATGEVLFFF